MSHIALLLRGILSPRHVTSLWSQLKQSSNTKEVMAVLHVLVDTFLPTGCIFRIFFMHLDFMLPFHKR